MPSIKEGDLGQATPAQRLKYIRRLARLTRKHIEESYQLPASTLKAWENGNSTLTEKGLQRCVEIYRMEGIALSKEWVQKGTGLPPRLSINLGDYFSGKHDYPMRVQEQDNPIYAADDQAAMVREAGFFKESYANAIVLMVADDNMSPVYQPGDYVGGRLLQRKTVEKALGKDCIVRLKNGDNILRRLFKNEQGGYNLACINPAPTAEQPIIFDADIEGVAPVIWHRMPDV